jgi:hypothetical protein
MARHGYAYVLVYLCALGAALAATGCSEAASPTRPTQVTIAAQSPAPVGLGSVSFGSGSVFAGDAATGTIALTGAAPESGLVVRLAATGAAATLPPTVLVSAGSTTATFTLTSPAVDTETVLVITAADGATTKRAELTVVPVPALDELDLSSKDQIGGDPVTGWVTLRQPAPAGGVLVLLGTSSRAASTPAGVTVKAGERVGTFTVRTSVVTRVTEVHVKAVLRNTTLMARLELIPPTGEDAGSGNTGGDGGTDAGTAGGGGTGGGTPGGNDGGDDPGDDGGDDPGDDGGDDGGGTCSLSLRGFAPPPGGGCGGGV